MSSFRARARRSRTDGTAVTHVADYFRALREQVASYAGTLRDVVSLAPAYARLMVDLLNEPSLGREQRLWVDAALAYLVSPDDVIPEAQVGAYGYLDDIFCCAYVANRVAEDLGWDVLEERWTGDRSAHDVTELLLGREQELLGHAGDDVLRFAGLLDRLHADEEADEGGLGASLPA